jgi:hypothetical protein
MKKLMILFGLLFSMNSLFAQGLKPVKIDSLVTISMPAGYAQKDTLGQHLFTANTDFGYLLTIVQPNAKNNQPLQKETDLNDVLKKYVKGIQSQSGNGSAQNVRDTTVGTLKAKVFTLRTDDGAGNIQYRDFLLIYTKDATYTFEYGYPEIRKDMIKDESKAYFGSIKLSPELQRDDQYINTKPASSSISPITIIEVAGGVLMLAAIIWLIFLKSRSKVSYE